MIFFKRWNQKTLRALLVGQVILIWFPALPGWGAVHILQMCRPQGQISHQPQVAKGGRGREVISPSPTLPYSRWRLGSDLPQAYPWPDHLYPHQWGSAPMAWSSVPQINGGQLYCAAWMKCSAYLTERCSLWGAGSALPLLGPWDQLFPPGVGKVPEARGEGYLSLAQATMW